MALMNLRNCTLTREPVADNQPARGQCVSAPEIGNRFVMLVSPGNTLTQTTPVEYIARDSTGVYFRTANNAYKLVWED